MSQIFGIKQRISDIYLYRADNVSGSKLKDLRN